MLAKAGREVVAKRTAGGDDLVHQFRDKLLPGPVVEQGVSGEAGADGLAGAELPDECRVETRRTGDTETVERDIPDQLFPVRLFEVGRDIDRDARRADELGDRGGQLIRRTTAAAEDDLAVGDVMDDAGLGAVEADKAHAAEDRLSREQFRQYSLVGQAVLECQQGGMLADQRRQQFAEAMVRRGLQGDDDEIARADFPRRLGGDWADMKIAV